jgi:MFS family permease
MDAPRQPQGDTPARPSAFSPFRHPVYRAIWSANLVSNLGATIQSVAAAWLMTELSSSNQMIGLVQASTTLPIMLFGLIAGAIADNFDRRLVMLAAQIGMLITSAALAVLAWLGMIGPLSLLGFTLLVGVGTALNAPAWQSSVRQTVPPDQLTQAIALNAMSFNTARSVGPALGGLLLSVWGAALAFAVNALSYIAIIAVLMRWRPEPRSIARRPILAAIGVGLRYCRGSSPIRRLLLRGGFLGFAISAYMALMPAMVRVRLGGDEFDFGVLLAVFGIGSIVAAPFVGQLRQRIALEGVLGISVIAYFLAMTVLAEAHSVIWAAPMALLAGMAWVAVLTSLNTAMQLRSPEAVLGRCLSIYQAVTMGGMAIGSWAWGALADAFSLPVALHAASLLLLAGTLLLRRIAPLPRPGEGVVAPS